LVVLWVTLDVPDILPNTAAVVWNVPSILGVVPNVGAVGSSCPTVALVVPNTSEVGLSLPNNPPVVCNVLDVSWSLSTDPNVVLVDPIDTDVVLVDPNDTEVVFVDPNDPSTVLDVILGVSDGSSLVLAPLSPITCKDVGSLRQSQPLGSFFHQSVYFIWSMVSSHQLINNNGAVYSITLVLMDKQALSRLVNLVRSKRFS
jgi:hypothetical protein